MTDPPKRIAVEPGCATQGMWWEADTPDTEGFPVYVRDTGAEDVAPDMLKLLQRMMVRSSRRIEDEDIDDALAIFAEVKRNTA